MSLVTIVYSDGGEYIFAFPDGGGAIGRVCVLRSRSGQRHDPFRNASERAAIASGMSGSAVYHTPRLHLDTVNR